MEKNEKMHHEIDGDLALETYTFPVIMFYNELFLLVISREKFKIIRQNSII